MKKFYFTFGCGQKHEGCYVIIEAEDSTEACNEMIRRYGREWSMQYTEDQWILTRNNDPYWDMRLKMLGCKSDFPGPITQAEMYNLKLIK